jgi:UDP-N-acetyl-D-mannosaminuronate dehydrogenase
LNEAVKRYVAKEKSKIVALKKAQKEAAKKAKMKSKAHALLMEKELKAPELPKSKTPKKEVEQKAAPKVKRVFKEGDVAILKSSQQKGTIEEINGNKVSLLVGNFIITTKLSELE